VIATEDMSFKEFGDAQVQVIGWPKEPSVAAKDQWIKDYSDHACLYLEVEEA
jgi:hypothetical protein